MIVIFSLLGKINTAELLDLTLPPQEQKGEQGINGQDEKSRQRTRKLLQSREAPYLFTLEIETGNVYQKLIIHPVMRGTP
jgi:hypothetical protein